MPTRPPSYRPPRPAGPAPSEANRGNSNERGYGSRWQRARLSFLVDHPLCESCTAAGKVEAATVVDHIIPHRGDAVAFWDQSRWQSLCAACHNAKTARGE